jgi:hypothetical protein
LHPNAEIADSISREISLANNEPMYDMMEAVTCEHCKIGTFSETEMEQLLIWQQAQKAKNNINITQD